MHIVLATVSTDGDEFPHVRLGAVLRVRGHRITVAAPEPYRARATALGLEFCPLATAAEVARMLADPDLWHPLRSGRMMARWGGPLVRRQYGALADLACEPATLVVANSGVLAARLVQERLGVPTASLLLQPGLLPSSTLPPEMPGELTILPWLPRPLRHLYWRAVDAAGYLLDARPLNGFRSELGLPPVQRLFRWWLSPDLVIGLFPPWYAVPQPDWPPQLRLAGFGRFDGVPGELPDDVRDFCAAGPPVAFTLGTGMINVNTLPPEFVSVSSPETRSRRCRSEPIRSTPSAVNSGAGLDRRPRVGNNRKTTPALQGGRGFVRTRRMTSTRRLVVLLATGLVSLVALLETSIDREQTSRMTRHPTETQITSGPGGRILTNVNVWSPDGRWVVYDTRSDPAGDTFDSTRIEEVNVQTREVQVLYESKHGAHCGVATWHPIEPKVAFILGPEHATPDWRYGPSRRQGVVVDARHPGVAANLDARDLVPPFTQGALRGGSHVHVWSPDGRLVSFTYEDQVLTRLADPASDVNQRNVGVSLSSRPVVVPKSHARNHDGEMFSVLATLTTATPRPGSDDITKAFEEGWVGTVGYRRSDNSVQRYALAFQGHVQSATGETVSEVFIVDLPDDLTAPGIGPLEGSTTRRPAPPKGSVQRRLTFTTTENYPGLQGPRHWLRSSPDGSRIGFLKKDDRGVVQFWTVSPNGGPAVQVTRNPHSVASAFTWHPDGQRVAFVMDNSVCLADVRSGETVRLTPRSDDSSAPRPETCVISPDGRRIAFVRRLPTGFGFANQICVVLTD